MPRLQINELREFRDPTVIKVDGENVEPWNLSTILQAEQAHQSRRWRRGHAPEPGCKAMIAIPTSATAAPATSQRVSATPSTKYNHSKATAIYMPP